MSAERREDETANTINCLRVVRDIAERISSGTVSRSALNKAYQLLEECGKPPTFGGIPDPGELSMVTWYTNPLSSMLAKELPNQEGKPWPEKTGRKPSSTG